MTDKTEAQRLADALCHYEAPMNMRAHQDAAALLLKQEAENAELRTQLAEARAELERLKLRLKAAELCSETAMVDAIERKLRARAAGSGGVDSISQR